MSFFKEIDKIQPNADEKYLKFINGELIIGVFDTDHGHHFLFKNKDKYSYYNSCGWTYYEDSDDIYAPDYNGLILQKFICHEKSWEINVEKYINLCRELLNKGVTIKRDNHEYFMKNGNFYVKYPVTCFDYLIYNDMTLLRESDIIPVILSKLYCEKLN